MGHIFDFNDARAYADYVSRQQDQWVASLESRLMLSMLQPHAGESILDIGCGTGASAMPLVQMGLKVTGLDPSPYMLDISLDKLGPRVDLYRGYAEDLPFDDNSFNHAVFFISLEFVDDPQKAIAEACRVAKDRVFIGFLNRFAIKGIQRWVAGWFSSSLFDHARFFSVWELKRIVRSVAGPVPSSWRTVCQFPNISRRALQNLEQSNIVQRCPFGTFAGMVVTVMPRFRTRPLAIRYRSRSLVRALPGSAAVLAGPLRPAEKDHSLRCIKQVK